MYDNPQITKTRSENFKLGIKEFSELCMLSLRNNNNFINSFVNLRPLSELHPKIKFFKQIRYTHTSLSNVVGKNNNDGGANSVAFNKLNPWFVTGFTDGEGCFLINLRANSKLKIGYSVELVFKIALHSKDKALIENLRNYFGVGTVTARSGDCIQFWVGSLADLLVIVHHFDNYPLITQKWSDYQLFKQVVDLMKGKEHLTPESLQKIVSIKAALNNGLSNELKIAFPETIPIIRFQINNQIIPDPHCIYGFVSGEGCFLLELKKEFSKGGSVGFRFLVTQHIRDAELLKSLENYLECGKYSIRSNKPMYGDFLVTKLNDIKNKIIPFFDKYPIQGVKSYDFSDLKKAFLLKGNNATLTKEDLVKFKQIKLGMNKGRIGVDGGINQKLKSNTSRRFSTKVTLSVSTDKRHYSTLPILNQKHLKSDQMKFKEWLAGLIDGDGLFKTTKKGFASFQIIMDINDKYPLYEIKHKYGGFVKPIAGSNALKYKITDSKSLICLIKDVNGLIRNPIRMLQLNKICEKFNIKLQESQPLTYNNGWFSGLIDSDGSIHIDEKLGQLTISVTQKNKYLLEPLQALYGGKISILKTKEAFKYTIFRKTEVLKLVDVYFKNFPLKSTKAYRVNLIKDFYLLEEHRILNVNQIDKFNQWITFKNKWDKL